MPVKRKMMEELKKRYGKEEGEDIYYAIEMKQKKKKENKRSKKNNY